mmetsp:Transcript_11158/g.12234  ORF Transcript_11158/g.12234 Transcript_11158/m.12234 type:complete len:199 (+) Transcript_11158:82-678(+)
MSKPSARIGKRYVNILVIGLDGCGKTTLITQMKSLPKDSKVDIIPTAGYEIHEVPLAKKNNIVLNMVDCSGQGRFRDAWCYFYSYVNAILYVIDSSDKTRLSVVKENIEEVLEHPSLMEHSIPIMFLANKIDLTDAIKEDRLKGLLHFEKMINDPKSHNKKMIFKGISSKHETCSSDLQDLIENNVDWNYIPRRPLDD